MRLFISLFTSVLLSQTLYQGSLDFSYNGSEIGSFSSSLDDTTSFGGALNLLLEDSSTFMMVGISPRENNAFDLFLTILQDSTYPIQPRVWSWDISIMDLANFIEDQNPLSLPTLSIFIPSLDSSFANQFLTFFTDTSNIDESLSLESLSLFFVENLLSNAYIALQGYVEINSLEDGIAIGNFSLAMWKPPNFTFTNVDSGNFSFSPIIIENLKVNDIPNLAPQLLTLHNAYPNPFNPQIKIPFSLTEGQNVKISIIDLNGRLINILSNQYFNPGNHSITFSNQNISSGIYFINIYYKNGSESQKITYLK